MSTFKSAFWAGAAIADDEDDETATGGFCAALQHLEHSPLKSLNKIEPAMTDENKKMDFSEDILTTKLQNKLWKLPRRVEFQPLKPFIHSVFP